MNIPDSQDCKDFKGQDWRDHKASVFRAVELDATFTHPNKEVHYIGGLYIYMITLIINGVPLDQVYEEITNEIKRTGYKVYQGWIRDAEKTNLDSLKSQMGWMKHAFVCCLRYLRLAAEKVNNNEELSPQFFEESMVEILMGGGDTDTNACIAGGVIGAILGFEGLPETPKTKVLAFDPETMDGKKRPEFLVPKHHAEDLIEELYQLAPGDLEKA